MLHLCSLDKANLIRKFFIHFQFVFVNILFKILGKFMLLGETTIPVLHTPCLALVIHKLSV